MSHRYATSDGAGGYTTFVAPSPDSLIRAVQKYRQSLNLEISPDETAKEICQANGYEYIDNVYSKTIETTVKKKPVNFAAIKSACNAIFENIRNNVESPAEISRRWRICKACPQLTKVSDCVSCSGTGRFTNWLNSIKAASKTNFHIDQGSALTYCGMCGCSHALMIPARLDSQKEESDEANKTRPELCWLRKDSKNYKP